MGALLVFTINSFLSFLVRFGTGATKRGAGAMGGALQGGPKTPKKTKFGTTMNATHANNHTKFTSSSSSNKSKNVLLSAKKAPPVMQSQQNFPRPVNSGVIGQKAPLGKLTRQPNFGVQSGPLRGIGAIAGVVAGGSKIATIGLNPNQKAKRRSLAQLQKKKTEPAGPSKCKLAPTRTCHVSVIRIFENGFYVPRQLTSFKESDNLHGLKINFDFRILS